MRKTRYAPEKSVDVKTFDGVQRWYGLTGNRRFEFDKMTRMHNHDNRPCFNRLFGPRHQTYLDDGKRYDVWRVEHEGICVWLLSAKAKGTMIRVEKTRGWGTSQTKKTVAFLDNIYAELKEIDDAD